MIELVMTFYVLGVMIVFVPGVIIAAISRSFSGGIDIGG